jgi:hypothetical protein
MTCRQDNVGCFHVSNSLQALSLARPSKVMITLHLGCRKLSGTQIINLHLRSQAHGGLAMRLPCLASR